MKLSPIQLLDYFVAEFHFSLNSKFDAAKPLEKKIEEMEATPKCDPHADKSRTWTIVLDVKYQPAAETNTPYIFSLKLVGVVKVDDTFDEKTLDRLVETNGPSVLYSIAREIIREQTARGPDGPFILPTASFLTPAKKPTDAPTVEAKSLPQRSVAVGDSSAQPKS